MFAIYIIKIFTNRKIVSNCWIIYVTIFSNRGLATSRIYAVQGFYLRLNVLKQSLFLLKHKETLNFSQPNLECDFFFNLASLFLLKMLRKMARVFESDINCWFLNWMSSLEFVGRWICEECGLTLSLFGNKLWTN